MNQPTPPPDKPQGAQTPRTDAAAAWVGGNCAITVIDEMRKMEKQLTAASEALEKAKAELASNDVLQPYFRREQGSVLQHHGSEVDRLKTILDDVAKKCSVAEKERNASGKREAALREALHGLLKHEAPAKAYGPESLVIGKGYVLAALSQQAPTNDTQG